MSENYSDITELSLPEGARRCVVIHYSEIGLKGQNRVMFENRLIENIKRALSDLLPVRIEKAFGRFYFLLPEHARWHAVEERLAKIFGIAYFAPAVLIAQEMELIEKVALVLMAGKKFGSFRITTRRSQKHFPLTSMEINRRIGAAVQTRTGARVDLSNPEQNLVIEIFDKYALLYTDRFEGLRGLPSGVSEKAVSLLSSGIDSPVASYKIMKRGVRVVFVHFHSAPATSLASVENVKRIVEKLVQYQYSATLYLVPFLQIQQEIMLGARPDYRVIHYRRAMVHLAERIAARERASALVTGESVGQVASQTLSNVRVVNQIATLPILRPLSGDDKEEIIRLAKGLGTFEISIQPYEDCCSLFVPRNPVTRASLNVVLETEQKLALDASYRKALQESEKIVFKFPVAGAK